jgi:hypothetical protein
MFCELCMYYNDQNECSIYGDITDEHKSSECTSFVERPFVIGRAAGCCGLSGLPTTDSCDADIGTSAEVDSDN